MKLRTSLTFGQLDAVIVGAEAVKSRRQRVGVGDILLSEERRLFGRVVLESGRTLVAFPSISCHEVGVAVEVRAAISEILACGTEELVCKVDPLYLLSPFS